MYEALRAAKIALGRPGGPEFGPKGRDVGLIETIAAILAEAEGRSNG
jgi:hypothetical protein